MTPIAHRRNTIDELLATPAEYGVEIDLRSRGDDLILHHDPFHDGETLDQWLKAYRHRTLILNVKEEGLEERLIAVMRDHKIEDYFFLDQSFPFLMKTSAAGERRSAVRVSEIESIDTALALQSRVDWVWVDSFTRFPLDRQGWLRLRDAGFRLCLVSPELVGRPPAPEILALRSALADWGVVPDAVCAKLSAIPLWTTPLPALLAERMSKNTPGH
jgi:hypothetical protein